MCNKFLCLSDAVEDSLSFRQKQHGTRLLSAVSIGGRWERYAVGGVFNLSWDWPAGRRGCDEPEAPSLFSQQFCEIAQFFSVQIRDDAVVEAVEVAVDEGIAAALFDSGGDGLFGGPNKNINGVLIAAIDESHHSLPIQIIQAAAN
jgi:hypothetical protein